MLEALSKLLLLLLLLLPPPLLVPSARALGEPRGEEAGPFG